MMKTVTTLEMQALDREASERFGIPSLLLMENAGRGIAELVVEQRKGGSVTVLCGKGNNGGDGLVSARHLANRGYDVRVLLAADAAKLKADPLLNFKIVNAMGIPVRTVLTANDVSAAAGWINGSDILVDALLGIGLNSDVRSPYAELISAVNESGKFVIAADVPSGLDSDTGEIRGCCARAAVTGTLGAVKQGLTCGKGPEYSGTVRVLDISIPSHIFPR